MSAYFLKTEVNSEGVAHFSAVKSGSEKLVLELISLKDGTIKEIPFEDENNIGSVCNLEVRGVDPEKTGYRFKCGDEEFVDPYAYKVSGDQVWGKYEPVGRIGCYRGPEAKRINARKRFSDLILYHIHVRGFTRHKSSGVRHRGTFEGVTEKIPYLKELGINALELMPAYDFNEIIPEKAPKSQEDAKREANAGGKSTQRLNYWGYAGGDYFLPKNSYSSAGDGPSSFVEMINSLHQAGIEVITDFYFEPRMSSRFVVDVLRHWVMHFGVDGFALFGSSIPIKDILEDPYLSDTKFIFERWQVFDGLGDMGKELRERIAVLNESFLPDNRKFLKSDSGMLSAFSGHLLEESQHFGLVNYMSSFNTMTINDAVSYDRKHNEENGENNEDGTDNNYSWNCGVEGNCRRKAVLALRERQVKNSFAYLLLSRGIPKMLQGDEFRNSQKGNNNPYCLDNNVTWLDWRDMEKNGETLDLVKNLLKLRKENPIFRRSLNNGKEKYPETSFHGEMAWQASFHDYFRHLGVLYSGKGLIYCAFNAHWQDQTLALPKPGNKEKWECILCTYKGWEAKATEDGYLNVPPRSVIILKAK